LMFCTNYGFGDHSLEDFQIMLEKIRNKKIVHFVQNIPKNLELNSKNLQVVTRLGVKTGTNLGKQRNTITKVRKDNDLKYLEPR